MPARPNATRYLSQEQVAENLGVTTRSVRRWIADGTIPAYRLGSKVVRIRETDLDAALRRIPAGGDAA